MEFRGKYGKEIRDSGANTKDTPSSTDTIVYVQSFDVGDTNIFVRD